MAKYSVDGNDLTSIADSIRSKGGISGALSFPDGFIDAIDRISASGATLITKSITTNGDYSASNDDADGYSSVSVNVQTPAYISGTFTGTTAGEILSIPLPYSGNGHQVGVLIYPTGGPNNNISDYYSLVQRRAINIFALVKEVTGSAPDYTSSDGTIAENKGFNVVVYKNSDSDASVYNAVMNMNINAYGARNPEGSSAYPVKFDSASSLKVFIADTSYGFAKDISYTYHVVYSS